MAKERVPAQSRPQPRDDKDNRTDTVKGAWRKSGKHTSLKTFARAEVAKGDPRAIDWFHNKTANTSKPGQGIGSTRKKKTKQGGGPAK